MTIKIKIGTPKEEEKKETQARVSLNISKTLANNLLITDHQQLDIVIEPKTRKIIALPKPYVEEDVYSYQKDLMDTLFRGGVLIEPRPEGGLRYGVVEAEYPSSEEVDALQVVLYEVEKFIRKSTALDAGWREYDKNIEDRFTDPTDKDSTAYGEIPPYEDTPGANQSADPTYTYAGYGYLY